MKVGIPVKTSQIVRANLDIDIATRISGINTDNLSLNVYVKSTFVPNTSADNDICDRDMEEAAITAAKDNSTAIFGMAPGARLWAVKVLDDDCGDTFATVVRGIYYVTSLVNEIDIALLTVSPEAYSQVLQTALLDSVRAGVTYVIPTGNKGLNQSL